MKFSKIRKKQKTYNRKVNSSGKKFHYFKEWPS